MTVNASQLLQYKKFVSKIRIRFSLPGVKAERMRNNEID